MIVGALARLRCHRPARGLPCAAALLAAVAVGGCAGTTAGTSILGPTSATLNAAARCDAGQQCTWYWEYWPSAGPRSASVRTAVNGPVAGPTSNVTLSVTVTGLQPGTTYRWVLCGSPNSGGIYLCVGPHGTMGSANADPPPDYETFTTPAGTGPAICQAVAIPAYFYPAGGAGLWSTAESAAPGVGIMVANVDSGPGTTVDPSYVAAIAHAQAAGVQVFGYVHTSYGTIGLSSAEADIDRWRILYGVTSIFVDEASTTAGTLPYYEALTSYVHRRASGARTIVNFGTIPAQGEMSAGDIAVTFEGDYASYRATGFPPWATSYAPSRFYNIVYGVPDQGSMANVLTRAAANNVGYVYATDDTLPNPYDTLPSYLTGEARYARLDC